jgi:hypothetical protein
VEQVDAVTAQPGQLPDPEPAVGPDQHQGAGAQLSHPGPHVRWLIAASGTASKLGRARRRRSSSSRSRVLGRGLVVVAHHSPASPGTAPAPAPGRSRCPGLGCLGLVEEPLGVGLAGEHLGPLAAGWVAVARPSGIARAMFRVAVSGRREQVVVGRLQQGSWTAEGGSARSVVEVVAEELGASLRWQRRRRPGRRGARSRRVPRRPGRLNERHPASWKLWLQDLALDSLETSAGIVGGMV